MGYRASRTLSRWCYLYTGVGGFVFFVPFLGVMPALGAASGLVIYCLLITLAAWLFHKGRRRPFTTAD